MKGSKIYFHLEGYQEQRSAWPFSEEKLDEIIK